MHYLAGTKGWFTFAILSSRNTLLCGIEKMMGPYNRPFSKFSNYLFSQYRDLFYINLEPSLVSSLRGFFLNS